MRHGTASTIAALRMPLVATCAGAAVAAAATYRSTFHKRCVVHIILSSQLLEFHVTYM